MKEALTDFLTNRPESTLGKLRPIAEMPETVPEGCVRVTGYLHQNSRDFTTYQKPEDHTHGLDTQPPTPDPEAEERQRFEEAMKTAFPLTSFTWSIENDGYKELDTESAWQGWKLAKAK